MYRTGQRKKRVFISYDYDNDRRYRYLLSALNANSGSDIEFEDRTPGEIQSSNVASIKRALARRINDSNYTLVIIGKYANSYHTDRAEIGERNWQWWEIKRAGEASHKFIAVKIDRTNSTPEPLYNVGAKWAYAFDVAPILKAIREA